MRRASVVHRLDRLADRGRAGDRERLIHEVAAESGLGIAEVRAELGAIEEHRRWYGPSTLEQTVRRCAEELGLPEVDLWAEVAEMARLTGARP